MRSLTKFQIGQGSQKWQTSSGLKRDTGHLFPEMRPFPQCISQTNLAQNGEYSSGRWLGSCYNLCFRGSDEIFRRNELLSLR